MSYDIVNIPEVKDKRLNDVEKQISKMQKRASEFCQSRSNFQIESFVAGEEYTPITKFRHVAHNSYVAMQEIRRMIIDRERKIREIEFKQKAFSLYSRDLSPVPYQKDDIVSNYDLDVYELSRQLEDIDIRIKGLSKEVDYMESICDELEKKEIEQTGTGFTSEKFQKDEPKYWRLRLANQMHCSQISKQLGVDEGSYMSMLMGMETPILEDSINHIEGIPLDENSLAVTALQSRDGVGNKLLVERKPPDNQLPK